MLTHFLLFRTWGDNNGSINFGRDGSCLKVRTSGFELLLFAWKSFESNALNNNFHLHCIFPHLQRWERGVPRSPKWQCFGRTGFECERRREISCCGELFVSVATRYVCNLL